MTALERAKQIAHGIGREFDKRLCASIEGAINEHSNAESERRRAVEARLRKAAGIVRTILANTKPVGDLCGHSEIAQLAKHAVEVLEGRAETRERIEKALEGDDA